jgi:hypothetical protein
VPSVDPRVTIQVPAACEIHLIVRVPVKSGERGFIEQAILTDVFLNNDFSKKSATSLNSTSPQAAQDPETGQQRHDRLPE